MYFTASSANLLNIKADSLIVATGSQLQNSAKDLDASLDGAITSLIKAGDFKGKAGETLIIYIPVGTGKRIILVGTEGATTAQQQIRVTHAGATALLMRSR